MAGAFSVLAFGLLCATVGSAGSWLRSFVAQSGYPYTGSTFETIWWVSVYARQASPVLCGAALCLLARGERRYPDSSRGARMVVLCAGVALLSVALLGTAIWNEWTPSIPAWVGSCVEFVLSRPLIPPVIAILACSYASDLGKRGHSRLLSTWSQIPLYPAAAGVVFWLTRVDQLFWPLRSIVCEWLFPLSMIVLLGLTVRVLMRGAREADQNWMSD